MNFKRFNGSTWDVIHHKTYDTLTESLTTFPAMIQASGDHLTDYAITGNTVQNGTPAPDAPVDVQGCGVRTGNLLNYTTAEGTPYTTVTQISGGVSVSGKYYVLFRTVQFVVGRTYTMSWKANTISGTSALTWRFHYADSTYSSMSSSGIALMAEKEVTELLLYVSTGASCVVEFTEIMLNEGNTAPASYIPYGYKIPITCGGETKSIYLGTQQSTRRIKKLVLTGEEDFVQSVPTRKVYRISVSDYLNETSNIPICTQYKGIAPVDGTGGLNDLETAFLISASGNNYYYIRDDRFNNANDFKTYLATQYAAGTPVTVWYVLAEPETAIVNEPLHKIGNYADTITMAQAGETIPTFDGDNTISFGTTVQPSGMSATFKGWHPVQGAKTYDGNDWS